MAISIKKWAEIDIFENENEDEFLDATKDFHCDDAELNDSLFLDSIKISVKDHLDIFFASQEFHAGGKIPKRMLHCPRRLSMIFNIDISMAVEIAYRSMADTLTQQEIDLARRNSEATKDVILVNEILKRLARSGVPQQFSGGFLLLYLEFCEGINYLDFFQGLKICA